MRYINTYINIYIILIHVYINWYHFFPPFLLPSSPINNTLKGKTHSGLRLLGIKLMIQRKISAMYLLPMLVVEIKDRPLESIVHPLEFCGPSACNKNENSFLLLYKTEHFLKSFT